MTKFSIFLLLIGAVTITANAQEENKKNLYVKGSINSAFAETKVYLGERAMGWGFEAGYDFAMPDSFSFISPWIAYTRFIGDPRPDFDVLQPLDQLSPRYDLNVWQMGLNFKYQTPLEGLRPWVGLSLNYIDGNKISNGVAPGDNLILAHPINEGKAKLGVRVGVDYYIKNTDWSVHLQYDASYWKSDSNYNGGTRVNGLNPIRPSWFSLSAAYHF
ncbi:MAG: outer membrane beta-barrel protein [Holophagales bacterium]|jgi:hypothetical protein|nr:outer membrane beta-barrel protein [Holophagales bacterium]